MVLPRLAARLFPSCALRRPLTAALLLVASTAGAQSILPRPNVPKQTVVVRMQPNRATVPVFGPLAPSDELVANGHLNKIVKGKPAGG